MDNEAKKKFFGLILKNLDDLTRLSVDLELLNDEVQDITVTRNIVDRVADIKNKAEVLSVYTDLYIKH
jgi:hypothetical protein